MSAGLDIVCAELNIAENLRGCGYRVLLQTPGRSLLAATDGNGAWWTGWEAAAETIAELTARLSHEGIAGLDGNALDALFLDAYEVAARRVEERSHEQIGAVSLLIDQDRVDLFWAGAYKLFHIRGGSVIRQTKPHVAAEKQVGALSRTEAYAEDPLDPFKFKRERGLQVGYSSYERLPRPWSLQPGDSLLLGNLATWRRFDDAELVARVQAGEPPLDPSNNEYQFSAIVRV
jgi:hypothetical protein